MCVCGLSEKEKTDEIILVRSVIQLNVSESIETNKTDVNRVCTNACVCMTSNHTHRHTHTHTRICSSTILHGKSCLFVFYAMDCIHSGNIYNVYIYFSWFNSYLFFLRITLQLSNGFVCLLFFSFVDIKCNELNQCYLILNWVCCFSSHLHIDWGKSHWIVIQFYFYKWNPLFIASYVWVCTAFIKSYRIQISKWKLLLWWRRKYCSLCDNDGDVVGDNNNNYARIHKNRIFFLYVTTKQQGRALCFMNACEKLIEEKLLCKTMWQFFFKIFCIFNGQFCWLYLLAVRRFEISFEWIKKNCSTREKKVTLRFRMKERKKKGNVSQS